ncbi:hypothetical protein ACC685_38095, partial [Rhizobium ruizarguesonis]
FAVLERKPNFGALGASDPVALHGFQVFGPVEAVQSLHPMGWDSFGLPAERHAMRNGVHPDIKTKRNIETFRGQVQRLGFSYD